MYISPAPSGKGWSVPVPAQNTCAGTRTPASTAAAPAVAHNSAHQPANTGQPVNISQPVNSDAKTSSTKRLASATVQNQLDDRQRDQDYQPRPSKPAIKPANPRFSSGPCAKHPGWKLENLGTANLGRSHRASEPKARLLSAIERCKQLMQLPEDWVLGIVPGSDTGAFEMAMWSLLGSRGVDVLVWESFSADWAKDIEALGIAPLNVLDAPYGELPDLEKISSDHDLVMVANGTTSGVRLPDFDFIDQNRNGLTLCDATSAVFAQALDYSRLDVVTWSWQKVLGGEAAHGMLALSPRALARLEQPAPRALPKLFRLAENGKLNSGIFKGATINTPGMLAVEDLHSALDWAEQLGGCQSLIERAESNFREIDEWVGRSAWIDWLAKDPATLSRTSMCLQISAPVFTNLDNAEQASVLKSLLKKLEQQQVAYDIANYRSAPTGFRIWGGATIESADLQCLTQWLDWVYHDWENSQKAKTTALR